MHRSDIYYINTPDAGHYVSALNPVSQGVDGRTFDIVSEQISSRMAQNEFRIVDMKLL